MIRIAVFVMAGVCLLSAPAAAQVASCTATPPAAPVGLVPGQTRLVWGQPDHHTLDQDKQPIITDYRGEVTLSTDPTFQKVVSNWTIPKASLQEVGTGSNCYQTFLPAMTGILPANLYVVRVLAIGRTSTATGGVSSNPFFLPGAPQGPANTRLYPPLP